MKADWRIPLLVFTVLFLGLYLAWLLAAPDVFWERFWVGNLVMVFSGMACCWLALVARRAAAQEERLRSAWSWLTAGVMIWTAGDWVRMAMEVRLPLQNRGMGLTDFIFLCGSGITLVGLLLYPRVTRRPVGRLRLFIDTAITTTAAVTLVWLLILQPVAQVGWDGSTAILYPSADLILLLLLLVLFLISEPGTMPPPLGWLALGFGVYLVTDLAYAYLLSNQSYQTGSLVNMGWVIGDLMVLLAAWTQVQPSRSLLPASVIRAITPRAQAFLPLAATLTLAWYTLLEWQLDGQLQSLGLWVTVLLALGFIARQSILAGEIEMQQYAGLVNSIAEPTFICTRQGKLGLTNPAFLEITRYRASQELLGLPLQQFIRPAQRVPDILRDGLSTGWGGEVFLLRSDGSWTPVFLSLRPLASARGEGMALAGTAHDLTEIKRQQTALQQAYEKLASTHMQLEVLNSQLEQRVEEKTASLTEAYSQLERQNLALQNLDRLKSDFVSLVSHELRAPLTNISGGIELVLARSASLSQNDRDAETLTLVQGEIGRLTRFIETILDLSALDAGRMPLYPAPVELSTIVEGLKRQMMHLPEAERVQWNIPAVLPPFLADEQALLSVMYHLLDNALKYAPTGLIEVAAGFQDERGWVSVSDEGEGIQEEFVPLLFTRFFRARSSDNQTVYGHGLGLYIVDHLLSAMDGKITVNNRPLKGACFTCWLPLALDGPAGDEPNDDQQNPVGG